MTGKRRDIVPVSPGRFKCRKIKYATYQLADDVKQRQILAHTDHPSRLARLRVYFCTLCSAYHLGHGRSAAQARELAKRTRGH